MGSTPTASSSVRYGKVAEWSKAAILKIADPRKGSVGSNPTLSSNSVLSAPVR